MTEEEIEITEENRRLVDKVKPFGTGRGGHITIPLSLAEVGDRLLMINLEDREKGFKKYGKDEQDGEYEYQCCRCNYQFDFDGEPEVCPNCGYALWYRDEIAPTWKNQGIITTD